MNALPEDQKIIDLLTKLKRAPNGYPSDMLRNRRQLYMKQVANVGLGLGAGTVMKNAGKGNGAGTAATAGSKIIEIMLIAAIAIEAGAVTYLYRDKIAAFLGLIDPRPVVATQPAFNPVMPETVGELQTPLTDASATPSAPPTETPPPAQAGESNPAGANNNSSDSNDPASLNANATPDPGGNQGNQYGLTPQPERTKDNQGGGNQGNQYGLTPKPERTKENQGGGNNNGGNNNSDGNNGGGKKDK